MYRNFKLVDIETAAVRSGGMSPERTRRLITEVVAWIRANHIKQKDLAATLGMSPQQLNNILKDRTDPTGEQTLHLEELIKQQQRRRGLK